MMCSFKLTSVLSRSVHQAISRNIHVTSRLLSGKVSNKLTSLLRNQVQREHKYVLPYLHSIQIAETEIVLRLSQAFNFWLNVPTEKLDEIIGLSCSTINSLIIIDDITDNATQRYDIPAAHTIFSVGNSITAANLILLDNLRAAQNLGHPDTVTVLIDSVAQNYQGQAMEVYWRENGYTPTEEEYEKCVLYKTGGLFGTSIKLMELFSKNKYDLNNLIKVLVKYYQMRDDYNDIIEINMKSSEANDDISAGHYTYPIIHALLNNPDDLMIRHILRLRTTDPNIKKYLASLLKNYGSLEHTRKLLDKLELEVREELEKLETNPLFNEIMDDLKLTDGSTK